MDIAEFLLARVAEDEAAARAASSGPWSWGDWENDRSPSLWRTTSSGEEYDVLSATYDDSGVEGERADKEHIERWQPLRVLAECEAKRAIVRSYQLATYDKEEMEWILDCLAFPYADHPDCDPAWALEVGAFAQEGK